MDRLPHYCPICAYLDWNMEGLIEMVWDYLAMVGGLGGHGGSRCPWWLAIVAMGAMVGGHGGCALRCCLAGCTSLAAPIGKAICLGHLPTVARLV